jgi:hypothetical protein
METPNLPKSQPLERFKAYADAPDRTTKNKYIVYPTHDIDHSINLLLRMVKAGWKVRAAYHVFADSRSVKIDHHAKTAGLI